MLFSFSLFELSKLSSTSQFHKKLVQFQKRILTCVLIVGIEDGNALLQPGYSYPGGGGRYSL